MYNVNAEVFVGIFYTVYLLVGPRDKMNAPEKHTRKTERLARQLKPSDVYNWVVTAGYYPEPYVLPPCFCVCKHPRYGRRFSTFKPGTFAPPVSQVCEVHFPKSDLTDRTFGIMAPDIHSDIAREVAANWEAILDVVFSSNKKVYTYSFPIPVASTTPGQIGSLRAGRMIYEWIEMAERDLVEEAYRYKYLVRADVKNFYPSVYTHSIAWALHTRAEIRKGSNRRDFSFLGNRLDKLFQSANDGCTNGLPIGPVVSDLMAEIVLSAVDINISSEVARMGVLGLRFKDDYRFLCRSMEECRGITKILQRALKDFSLLLSEEKTQVVELPEGIFREWKSRYHGIRLRKGTKIKFREFQELYLGVLRIDREVPGTGIIDTFIADITDDSYMPRFPVTEAHAKKIVSLLLLLGERRIKSFPGILGLLEAMMVSGGRTVRDTIQQHLNRLLGDLSKDEESNRYIISWMLYFLKSNNLPVRPRKRFNNPILASIQGNRMSVFTSYRDFKLFRGVRAARRAGLLLKHIDAFGRKRGPTTFSSRPPKPGG
jgi:hypothetical protein